MALFSVFSLITAVPASIFGGYLYGKLGPLASFMASVPIFLLASLTLARIGEPEKRAPELDLIVDKDVRRQLD
jgi:hypothetical protein